MCDTGLIWEVLSWSLSNLIGKPVKANFGYADLLILKCVGIWLIFKYLLHQIGKQNEQKLECNLVFKKDDIDLHFAAVIFSFSFDSHRSNNATKTSCFSKIQKVFFRKYMRKLTAYKKLIGLWSTEVQN